MNPHACSEHAVLEQLRRIRVNPDDGRKVRKLEFIITFSTHKQQMKPSIVAITYQF
jgi:hypothetical protein